MTPETTAALAAAVAAVAAAAVFLAGRRAGPALAAGFAAGALPVVWPLGGAFEGWKYVWAVALAGGALGSAEPRLNPATRWALRLAALVGVAWLVAPAASRVSWTAGALLVAGLAAAAGFDGLARRDDGAAAAPVLFVVAVASAVSLERGVFMDGAFLAGALAAATAAVFVLRRKRGGPLQDVATPAALVLAALWTSGATLAELPLGAALPLAAAAPAASIVGALGTRLSPRARVALSIAVAALVAGAGVAVAAAKAPSDWQ